MKVFISWSGERSGQIAALLRKWLPMIHQGIEAYVSAQEIGKGERWASNLDKELESSNFGLVCLTPENVSAPWLHFEAGALSKVADSRVAPILFELQPGDVQGPLSQFQAAVPLDNEQEMLLLLRSISQTSGEKTPYSWEMTFKHLWGGLQTEIAAVPRDAQDQIQITSPVDGGVLEDPRHWSDGLSYVVRGRLSRLPGGHAIWLLNASSDGRQWPQGFFSVRYPHPRQGEWEGRIYLPYANSDTFINAVVAPPTSQQLFEYYERYGKGNALTHIPIECTNKTQIWVKAPTSHKGVP